jgi:hypothetical protein
MNGNHVCYEVFRAGGPEPWESLFETAAEFASQVGPDRLIGISHSAGEADRGVATVWYWRDPVR